MLIALPLLLVAGVPASADTPPPVSASVIMTDTGYNPPAVTIQPGGSVSWTNQGANVHTATTIGGAPLPFNTGGVGPGQSTSLSLGVPGKYYYTSSTDCLNGVYYPSFPCSGSFLIEVTSASVVATSAAATATAAPSTPTPTATLVPSNLPQPSANVTITDEGISPATATIALNGSVTFINQSTNVHTATRPGTATDPGFDTGGLAQGQIMTIGFSQAGTFSYTSAPDCLNGNKTPGFDCGPYDIVVSPVALPQPTSVPTAAPTAVPALAAPNPNTSINIDDASGFTPSTLNIKAGQTVTWTNKGSEVHTVTSNSGYLPAFDSGGLSTGQSFSTTFSTPGSFSYHSQTDVTYSNSSSCNCVVTTYLFNGLINVTS